MAIDILRAMPLKAAPPVDVVWLCAIAANRSSWPGCNGGERSGVLMGIIFRGRMNMRAVWRLVVSVALLQILATSAVAQQPVAMKKAAPEFQGIDVWINSKPLTLKALRGKVVVLHFWTFD